MAKAQQEPGVVRGTDASDVEGTFGIWLNKRELEALDIPIRHQLTAQNNGWRLEFLVAGRVVARHRSGTRQIDVEAGDSVVSSGDDLYVSLHRSGNKPDDPKGTAGPREEETGGRGQPAPKGGGEPAPKGGGEPAQGAEGHGES